MPGWNGSGIFELQYVFVQDAANGIKILASRQDTQWTLIANGLMNCQTRDGQNKPLANWDFNGFTLNNLGAPVNPSDAARLQDITSVPAGEWLAEANAFTFVNATSFKLTGANLTARYQIGRRLKITHNTGGTTSYYTVTASSFAAGDTTVSVSGPTLVTTLTAVSYAMLDAANPSVPVFSAIGLFCAAAASPVSGVDYVLGGSAQFPATTVTGDIYTEFSAGVVTVKYTGLYLVNAVCRLDQLTAGSISSGEIRILKNGAIWRATSPGIFTRYNSDTFPIATATLSDIVSLTAGDTVQVKTNSLSFTGTSQGGGSTVNFLRVR